MSLKARNACRLLRVQPAQKAALLVLADYARDDGSRVYPSLHTLEIETCLSESTLRRAIRGLERLAVLVPTGANRGGRQNSNRYDIDLIRVAELIASQGGEPADPEDANPVNVTGFSEPAEAGNPVTVTAFSEPAEDVNPVTVTLNPVTVTENPVTVTPNPLRPVRPIERELQATLLRDSAGRQWSPKVDDPKQTDIETWLADNPPHCAAEYLPPAELAAVPISTAAPVMDQPAAGCGVVAYLADYQDKPRGSRCKATGDAGFDEFYAAYPRHKDPEHARAAYLAALRRPGVTHAVIMQGVAEYRAEIARDGTAMQYVKHPKTWLNAGSYLNKADPMEGAGHGNGNQHRRQGGNIASRIVNAFGVSNIPR